MINTKIIFRLAILAVVACNRLKCFVLHVFEAVVPGCAVLFLAGLIAKMLIR